MRRKTAQSSRTKALRSIRHWCRRNMHAPVAWQHQILCAKLRGHYQYFGITGNATGIRSFYAEVRREWRKWLSRRCWKGTLFWDRYRQLLDRYPLAPPRLAAHRGRP